MLPFQSNLSQYMAEMYASASFYPSLYVYPNQENCWQPLGFPDAPALPPPTASLDFDPQLKAEEPTKPATKPRRPWEKPRQESSASCPSADEESEESPDIKSRQKYGRNISSNIFHQMLKAIRGEERFEEMLERLLASGRFEITSRQFHEILHKRAGKLNPYVSTDKMNSFLNGVPKGKAGQGRQLTRVESDFLRVLRVLCRHYLTHVHLLYVFNKLKLQKQSKVSHVRLMRNILQVIAK